MDITRCTTCGTEKDLRELTVSDHGTECVGCIKVRMNRPGYFSEKVNCVCCGSEVTRYESVKTKEGRFCANCYESSLSKFFMRLFGHINKKELDAAREAYAELSRESETTEELSAVS